MVTDDGEGTGLVEPRSEQVPLIDITRSSTKDQAWLDPYKVSLVVSLRPAITRVYLGSEVHYVDVDGPMAAVVDLINTARGRI